MEKNDLQKFLLGDQGSPSQSRNSSYWNSFKKSLEDDLKDKEGVLKKIITLLQKEKLTIYERKEICKIDTEHWEFLFWLEIITAEEFKKVSLVVGNRIFDNDN